MISSEVFSVACLRFGLGDTGGGGGRSILDAALLFEGKVFYNNNNYTYLIIYGIL